MRIQDQLDKVIHSPRLLVGGAFILFISAFQINRILTGSTGEWTVLGISVGAIGAVALVGAINKFDTKSKGHVFYLSTIGILVSAVLSDSDVPQTIAEVSHSLIAPLVLLFIGFGLSFIGESFGDWYLPDLEE